jgi:tetratricopeptide (TPR) repeat protein
MDVAERRRRIDEATLLYQSGRYADAVAAYAVAYGGFGDDDRGSEEFANLCGNYASALAETGDFKTAMWLFNAALFAYKRLGLVADTARIHFNLGNVYRYTNSHQRSMDAYQQALTAYRSIDDRNGTAATLLSLTHMMLSMGVLDEGEKYLAEVDQLRDAVEADPLLSWSLHFQQASLAELRGDLPAALRHLETALDGLATVPDVTYRQETESAIADLRAALGQRPSDDDLTAATTALDQTQAHRRRFQQTLALAREWHERGDQEQARALYDACLTVIDQTRSQLDNDERFHYMEQVAPVVHEYSAVLMTYGAVAQALAVSERGQGRTLLDLMFRHQIKRQGGRRIRVGAIGRILVDTPTVGEIRDYCRRRDLHVLKLLLVGGRTIAWLVDPAGGVEGWEAAGADAVLARLLDSFWWGSPFDDPEASDDEPAEIRASARLQAPPWEQAAAGLADLWTALLPEEIRARLSSGGGRLLIVPHGLFGTLPWSMLGPPDAPLGDRWQIGLAPSLGVALQLDRERDLEPWRGLGAFPLPAIAFGGIPGQQVSVPLLPGGDGGRPVWFAGLPATAGECRQVAATLDGAAVEGERATPEAFRLALGAAGILHVASHGFWNPFIGDLSFVVLSPSPATGENRLFQQEVVDLVSHAELVVLSGCQTGLGSPHPDTYITLANAFLIAGVRCVLVGLWPIRDDATAAVAACLHRRLRAGDSPAAALHAVHEEFHGLLDPWDHAGFTVLGNPFFALADDATAELVAGPALCGGDTIWMRDGPGDLADLTPHADLAQTTSEAWLVDYRGVHVMGKGMLDG